MSIENKIRQDKLEMLTDDWTNYKTQEQDLAKKRLAVENEALELLEDELETKGTRTLDTGLQITTGENETWDLDAIDVLYNKFQNGELNDLPFFPFDITYKPNTDNMKVLKNDNYRKDFQKIFCDALTVKPKKASFKIKK